MLLLNQLMKVLNNENPKNQKFDLEKTKVQI